jgi:hypothetical protein
MYVESDIGKIRTFLEDYIITTLKKELVANSLKDISLPGYDPTKQYVIVWSKQLGWKKVTFSWTERTYDENNNPVDIVHPKPDDPISYKEHTFNPDTDWNGIAKNLHAQDKISDQWGFLP